MKKTWVRKTLSVGIMAAGALLFAPAAAQAGGHHTSGAGQDGITQVSSSNVGFLNGTQIAVPITIPINETGNADSLFGVSSAQGAGVNRVEGGHHRRGGSDNGITQSSGGNVGFLNGTQIAVPITIPINQCGNASSIFGVSQARATCGNFIGANGRVQERTRAVAGDMSESLSGSPADRNGGTGFFRPGGGTGVFTPAQQGGQGDVLHNIFHGTVGNQGDRGNQGNWGNPVGGGNSWGNGLGGTPIRNGGTGLAGNPGGGWDNGINQTSFGNIGFLNGTQYAAPVIAPINVCGNSMSGLLGTSSASAMCVNRIGDDSGHRVKKSKGHKHDHDDNGDVQGDDGYDGDDCTKKCDDDDTGDVRGDNGYNGEKPAVNNDDNGYNDEAPAVNDDKGYGAEAPAVNDDDKGYGDVKPDKYGDKTGGRNSEEKATVGNLTGSLGGLDLLSTLR